MDRVFRIDFYPQDWLIDTARLPPDERGIYIQIVCLIYANRGAIENDPKWIAGVSGCSSRSAKTIIKRLYEKNFIQISDGKISQKRAENELKTKRKHLEDSSKGGRNSSEKRREYNKNKQLGSTEDQFMVPSPSPSPYTVEEKDTPNGVSQKKINLENLSIDHVAEWLTAKRTSGRYLTIDEYALLEIFKDYCRAKNPKYRDLVAAFRNSFNWPNAPTKGNENGTPEKSLTKSERLTLALDRAEAELNAKIDPGKKPAITLSGRTELSRF